MGWVIDEGHGFIVVALSSGERVLARRTARYREGWRWCGRCRLAYNLQRCPIHNLVLRRSPRRRGGEVGTAIEVGEV